MSHYKPYLSYKDSGVEWLGRVPEGWEVSRMRNSIAFAQNGVWGEDPDGGEDDISCARVADFDRENFTVSGELLTQRKIAPVQRKFRMVNTGDLLLEKSGGGEQTSVGAVVQYVGTSPVVCSNFVAVVKCNAKTNARWLCYVNAHLYSVGVNRRSIKQTTGIQNIDSDEYLSESIAVPSPAEQRAIAAHLDRETVRLDGLAAKKTRFIELLREKRQALITHAVTKGLDPTVKMKDSGVEWLGQVPEHWVVKSLRRIARIVRGASPRPAGDPQFFCDSDEIEGSMPWVTVAEITKDNTKNLDETATYLTPLGAQQSQIFKAGTLLFSNSGATLGVPKILGIDCCANDGVLAFNDLSRRLYIEFLYYFLATTTESLREKMQRGGQPNLNTDIVKSMFFAMPSLDEQKRVVLFIDQATTRLDILIEKTERSIALIKERRAALITAAVTGQIDLRAAP